jgi:hypothetical protein
MGRMLPFGVAHSLPVFRRLWLKNSTIRDLAL